MERTRRAAATLLLAGGLALSPLTSAHATSPNPGEVKETSVVYLGDDWIFFDAKMHKMPEGTTLRVSFKDCHDKKHTKTYKNAVNSKVYGSQPLKRHEAPKQTRIVYTFKHVDYKTSRQSFNFDSKSFSTCDK